MSIYIGTVGNVDADARRVRVQVQPLGALTGWLRCAAPFGLVAPLPAVGDEVLVACPANHLADGVVIGWLATDAQAADAADHPLIASAGGGVPTQTDPSANVGNAQTSGVLSR